MMPGRRKAPQSATVLVTRDDVATMRHSRLGLEPIGVKKAAKARAAGRELFLECKSVQKTIASLVAGLPPASVAEFCRNYGKQ